MKTTNEGPEFKYEVVRLILSMNVEKALEMLAQNYNVATPKFKIGLPKGHQKNVYGCYTSKTQTISLLSSDFLNNAFVVLHEFYHHLRSKGVDQQHRGTEKNADKFATDFITQYNIVAKTKTFQPYSSS